MGLGQNNSLGEYRGLSTASSVFLILIAGCDLVCSQGWIQEKGGSGKYSKTHSKARTCNVVPLFMEFASP